MTTETEDRGPEIEALGTVCKALGGLSMAAQTRILKYACEAYGIDAIFGAVQTSPGPDPVRETMTSEGPPQVTTSEDPPSAEFEGVSSVALKWITRSGFDAESLGQIFSLGGDEIDLIAQDVPGDKKRERMKNVLLLLGVASYLSSGAARVSDDKLRETCQHYDALDPTNFAAGLKSFAAEISGTKETGYTLNQRGLTAARDLIKDMLRAAK